MCVGHLYGVALYYSTSLTERAMVGTMHSRPEFLYFWVYYVGFNAPWVVVPAGECHDLMRSLCFGVLETLWIIC